MTAAAAQFRSLDSDALKGALDLHRRYLAGRSGGRRASLAHADLSGLSLFEEAQYRGVLAAERVLQRRGRRFVSSLIS